MLNLIQRALSFFDYRVDGRAAGVLEIPASITVANAPGVLGACIAEFNRTCGPLDLDCSRLENIDSAGAAILLDIFGRAIRAHRRVFLHNLRQQPRDVFALYGLDALIERNASAHLDDAFVVVEGDFEFLALQSQQPLRAAA